VADEVTFTGRSGTTWTYRTDQPLGKGGFGGVYAAEGPDGTPMAVKVVKKDRPSGTLDDRLLRREIDIGQRVRDSGSDMLLPVIDAADTADALLLVMTRAGNPLSTVLPMNEPDAIAAMTDIATGLQQLHQAGIIHRDLKPANVLQHDQHWKLADFGIARDQEIGTQDPTFIGAGSLPYMAPELWQLKSPTVKTDLYALGCLAFELLAGAPPYTGDLAALRTAHLTQAPPDAPCSNPTVKNLINRLISKNPVDRPQDARAVLDRLHRAAILRTPAQEAIAKGLGTHHTEKSRAAAEAAAAKAAAAARGQQITQGKADLREIFTDALEDLQAIEPDATLLGVSSDDRRARYSLPVSAIHVGLSVDDIYVDAYIWDGATTDKPVPGDTMLIAGQVEIRNPRHSEVLNCANLVYEQVGDRYAWQVYKFHSSALIQPDRYRYGPYSRTHGLNRRHFLVAQERYHMLGPGTHVWGFTVDLLTADTALDLFQEAVDLKPPDPRTRLY
jgi:serine/threonine protein kinase